MGGDILSQILILLAGSVAVLSLVRRFALPPVLGYLVVWTIYSVVAALVQAGLHAAALLAPAMAATSPLLAGAGLTLVERFQDAGHRRDQADYVLARVD